MRIDGVAVAEKIYKELATEVQASKVVPALAVIYIGQNSVTDTFVGTKQKHAEEIGAKISIFRFEETISEEKILKEIKKLTTSGEYHGIIVQLPLPSSFNTEKILNAVPTVLDVDVLSSQAVEEFRKGSLHRLPTVPGAIKAIFDEYRIDLSGKKIVVLGAGKLVGGPVASWLTQERFSPIVLERKDNLTELLSADVIISGIGVSHFVKPDMIKEGAILIDAGTSEQSGKVVGDIDPSCEEKALFFTPTPKGVGPITVAMLFKNLIEASTKT